MMKYWGRTKLSNLRYSLVLLLTENTGADEIRFTSDELRGFNEELVMIEIKGERLPKVVLDFSGIEAPIKK